MERGIRLTKTGATITKSGYRVNRILEGTGGVWRGLESTGTPAHVILRAPRTLIQRARLWDRYLPWFLRDSLPASSSLG